ncbi:hypothetical protein [Longispora albida]|uniref:hypothetical protein n=1 Tax=Longispora albida TaxID=203523 RepID=UPI00036582F3|nr:hypothetical protein [Longispora albida]
MADRPPCPDCGEASIPIMYGMPSYEAFQRAEAGELALGGCVVFEDAPRWRCPAGHVWREEG